MKAIITVGVSASGKTTWARNFIKTTQEPWAIVCRDDIRADLTEAAGKEWSWANWNWKRENEVTAVAEDHIARYAAAGISVIIADTNLNADRRVQLVKKLQGLGYDAEVKVFHIDYATAVKRDAARENGVGPSVIATQFQQYNKEFVQQYKGTPGRHLTVVVDIDGTLADHKRRNLRGSFDWAKVGVDDVNEYVRDTVEGLRSQGYCVVVLSGRDSVCRKETEDWLDRHKIEYHDLFMRAEGDSRSDDIVKAELFWQHVAPYYNVKLVIDDRPKVVRLWQSMGINTLAVGNQYVEF